MSPRGTVAAIVFACASAIGAIGDVRAARAAQAPSLLSQLLERYDRGDFEAAVRLAAEVPNLRKWSQQYPAEAQIWIAGGATPAAVARRRLVAAGLVLEVAHARNALDGTSWGAIRDVVEWGCQQLAQEPAPISGEQAWQRAAVALGQRTRDPSWLSLSPRGGHHLEHAWRRFPSDARLALASVVIGTRTADIDIDRLDTSNRSATAIGPPAPPPTFSGAIPGVLATGSVNAPAGDRPTRPDHRKTVLAAIDAFSHLLLNPEVGSEAEGHVSRLYLALHEWQSALDHARAAVALARDARPRYLGWLMSGLSLEQLDRPDEARAAYRQALDALPAGQTASLLLASLDDAAASPAAVATLVRDGLARNADQDDPWRLFFYGDYYYWPTYVADLHEALR